MRVRWVSELNDVCFRCVRSRLKKNHPNPKKMPKVSKMLIVRSIYRTRTVPNDNAKKGVSVISECGLCGVEFTDLSDRRAACHVLGVPGQGIAKCEHRADLDEDTRLELMDCCQAVKAWAARGDGGPSPIAGGGEMNPN